MFFFGHLGLGYQIAKPFSRRLPLFPLFLGTQLPDLVDKPLYYALSWSTGKASAELGLISCSRTFGHTAIVLLTLTGLAFSRRSAWLKALALGIATHLLLDNLRDFARGADDLSAWLALVWPLAGPFAPMPHRGLGEHLGALTDPITILSELAGLGILSWELQLLRRGSRS